MLVSYFWIAPPMSDNDAWLLAATLNWLPLVWRLGLPTFVDLEGACVNFMMDDEADGRVQATYGENYRRLASVKAKYDPENLFQVNQNILPAASWQPVPGACEAAPNQPAKLTGACDRRSLSATHPASGSGSHRDKPVQTLRLFFSVGDGGVRAFVPLTRGALVPPCEVFASELH
jgi:hypothetical protein